MSHKYATVPPEDDSDSKIDADRHSFVNAVLWSIPIMCR